MAEKTAKGLVAHARTQLGHGYVYATFGKVLTEDIIQWSIRTYKDIWGVERLAERIKRARGQIGTRTFDCAGLVKSYWMMDTPTSDPKYIAAKDQSAHGLYKCCKVNGKIASIPKNEPGILVFIWDSKRGCMRHVGLSDGKGRVIEAQGFSTGVIERALSSGSWTHWGRLDWLEHYTAPKPEKPVTAPPEAQNGAFSKGDLVRVIKSGVPYYPGFKSNIPEWLPQRKEPLPVTQVSEKGGVPCVLLGGDIQTWIAAEFIKKVED